MTERSKKMMEILLKHPEGVTGEFLANRLGVSSRTIRSDIRKLQGRLGKEKGEILSTPSRGYKLIRRSTRDDLMDMAGGKRKQDSLEDTEDRLFHMIGCLLACSIRDKSITQMELAEEMYLGISRIKNYLAGVRQWFSRFSLQISQYRTEGLRIRGDEMDFRNAVVSYLQKKEDKNLLHAIQGDIDLHRIKADMHAILETHGMHLTDEALGNLCVHLALAIQRPQYGHTIAFTSSVAQELELSFEHSASKDIANHLLNRAGIDLPYGEVFYLTKCLLTSKKLMDDTESIRDSHVREVTEKILENIAEHFNIDFTGDQYLRNGLFLHLRIAIARVNFHMDISNELLDSIKQDYPLAFQLGVLAAKTVQDMERVAFNESEIGYLALHFGAAMSRSSIEETDAPKRVVIVCSAGLGVSALLRAKVKEHFRHRINIVKVLPAYELTEAMLLRVDYVFSAVPIAHISSDKIIRINHMLRDEDIRRIESIVFHRYSVNAETVRGFFSPGRFFLDMDFSTREDCLEFLTEHAVRAGLMDMDTKKSVFERETMSATAIGDLTAIPHAINMGSKASSISIMTLKQPVPWGTLPVMAIFLLNIERGKNALWEEVFLKLFSYIKEENGLSTLLHHKSYERFLTEFIARF